MKNIGIVSCNKWINKISEDLLFVNYLNESGFNSTLISWEDSKVDYLKFDCLIIRSVWGYQNKYKEFKQWLLFLKENNIRVFNDVDTILQNISKKKQFEILDKYSIPHIPTVFVNDFEKLDSICKGKNIVVKPIISGSGEYTYRINRNMIDNDAITMSELIKILESKIIQDDNGIMIQPYFNGIEHGEYACVFLGEDNTHNMIRYPGIFVTKQKPIYCTRIPSSVYELAENVSNIPEFRDCLYKRVDIVLQNGIPYIMEVELAEPDLLLKYVPECVQSDIMKDFCLKMKRRF